MGILRITEEMNVRIMREMMMMMSFGILIKVICNDHMYKLISPFVVGEDKLVVLR